MKNQFWRRFFSFVAGSLVATFILIGISYLALGAKIGTGALLGENSLDMEFWREEWFNNFSWLHFMFQGMMLSTFNLLVKSREEIIHISWYEDGIFQLFGIIKLAFGFTVLEALAYLIQFVGNAIFVGVTNLVSEVTVPNLVSIEYLASRIDISLIIWEALLSALIISFFDRKKRRRIADAEEEMRRFEEEEKYKEDQRKKSYQAREERERRRKKSYYREDFETTHKKKDNIQLPPAKNDSSEE